MEAQKIMFNFSQYPLIGAAIVTIILNLTPSVNSQTPPLTPESIDLNPQTVEKSPLLQRWLEKIPDVLEDIQNDPSFTTRVRLGYAHFPSSDNRGGLTVGVEDIFLGKTGLTLSGDYQTSFDGFRSSGGANLQYYLLPLGSYVNIAPVIGYRSLTTNNYSTDGMNVGLKLMLPLSRGGGADLSVSQTFVSPGGYNEVGITTFSAGYAFSRHWRLATDIQGQNSRAAKDSQVSVILEWIP